MNNNDDAFKELSVNIATLYMRRSQNNYTYHEGSDLINTVAFAMNLTPDKSKIEEGASGETVFFSNEDVKKIDNILEAIKSIGGKKPGIIIYPVLLRIFSKSIVDDVVRLPIFCVKINSPSLEEIEKKIEFKFVDITARVYRSHGDFASKQVFPPGIIAFPKKFRFTKDSNGNAIIEVRKTETGDREALKAMDLTFSMMGIGAAALALTGIGAPIAIVLTATSASYGVIRSTVTLADRLEHNQSLNPFSDWEAFGAWTGIAVTALNISCAINALWLSEKVSRLAAEGLKISTTTRVAFHSSVFVPYAVNAALMLTQFIRMAEAWNNVPIEYKIITGLQFLFFLGASLRLPSLTVSGIQDQVAEIVYQNVRDMLAEEPDGPLKVATLDRMIGEIDGKYNQQFINSLRKIANYDNGVLFAASKDLRFSGFGTFEPVNENGEAGFRLSDRIYIGPEAAIQLGEDMKLAARDNPGLYYSIRMPETPVNNPGATPINTPVDQIITTRVLVNIEQVEQGRLWLETRLNSMENIPILQPIFWDNMRYHDQMRLRIFPNIEKSLNVVLTNLCLKYAAGDKIETVGQYASRFEISSLVFHRRANDLIAQIEAYKVRHDCKLSKAAEVFNIQTTVETETRLTYSTLPKSSNAFSENVSGRGLARTINNVGKKTAEGWRSSITITKPKIVNSANKSLQILANDVIAQGDLSYGKPEQLLANCSVLAKARSFPDGVIMKANFPKVVLENANKTIKSCKGHINERVVDISRQNEKFCKIAFWDLSDGKTAKCTVVTIDISGTNTNGECRIQNFTTRNIISKTRNVKNLKDAILDYYSKTYTAEQLKVEVDALMSPIENECKDYVGAQLVQNWENHDTTVSDIQNLEKVRFSSIEHAICHVLKHGEINTIAENVSAIKNYFQKAQAIIQYSKDHPECVSSEWTQTGSARDFTFYRPLENNRGVEKVVVLVREGGEVILKTYYEDTNITSVPPQQKHVEIPKLQLGNADLRTFYFQMMFLTPRFGVLLPNDFEIIENNITNKDLTRNIIIIAAHHFNEKARIKAAELSEALTKTYPSEDGEWNVFAWLHSAEYSFNFSKKTEWYIFARISEMKVVMFLRDKTAADSIDRSEIIKQYMKLSKSAAVSKEVNTTQEMRDVACRLVTNYSDAKHIQEGMNLCFGQQWIVFKLPEYNEHFDYDKYIYIRYNRKTYLLFC